MDTSIETKISSLYKSGLVLVAIRPTPDGKPSKGPRGNGWNRIKSNDNPDGYSFNPCDLKTGVNFNYGLLHSESKTLALDFDDLDTCRKLFFDIAEFDIDTLLNAPDRFQIKSPKSNRGKLIFSLPDTVSIDTVKKYSTKINGKIESIFELRGGPNQDVIIGNHPEGGSYEIIGDPLNIPVIPALLLNMANNWNDWRPVIDSFFGINNPAKADVKDRKEYKNDAIKEFNDRFTAREILERNGYRPSGSNRFYRPESTSNDGPPIILYDDGKVFSNGIDKLANGHSHDAFNCYKILECDDDFKKAINWNKEVNLSTTVVSTTGSAWITAGDLIKSVCAPVYLIDDVIESGTHGLLAGSSQSFKSFCVLKMAHSICTGSEFFGYEVFTTGKVLYICGEGNIALGRRISALNIVEGSNNNFHNNLMVKRIPMSIDKDEEMNWLRLQINELKPVLVIFDTFSSLATNTKENVNEEIARALKMVSGACNEAGSSSVVVHHYGKDADRGARGGGAFSANVDFELSMVRGIGEMSATLSCKKSKDGEYFKDININAHVVDLGLTRQNGKTSTSLVLKAGLGSDGLTDRQGKAFEAIRALINDCGYESDGHYGVNETQIKNSFKSIFRDDMANPYKAFSEVIPALKKKGKIEENDSFFWLK